MAWRSSGSTNAALIENLAANGLITSARVRQAMMKVDRAHYAPSLPYQDSPQPIGHRATISAPHMHAAACESLLPFLKPGAKVLDVGSGSGYLTHVLAELIQPGGTVVGLEHIQALADLGAGNTAKSSEGKKLLDEGGIVYVKGDGRRGWTGKGGEEGFDAIHVGAAAAGWHQELIDQLKKPGRLFIPVAEGYLQYIYVVDKDEQGNVTKKKEMGVQYVPLTDAPE
ncbi:protein-L-isoaspartate O-methyltransferas-like protein [Myriangium duriaei CBS 260.36]|uniref:protein-L-isoaspartate(D-aspartate) O-methyltransferase n=1 Tax=Myriangium duriaei CBS 260.36 TaxID=1168546 RepID=A0A9P4MRX8_9PEZI|nr:protein-L-isoaspartate O-methyltransferas-like protein [Myriangium duriaei CBS 260.36]